MQRTSPPFRADINGSFLRPQCVIDARVQFEEGKITAEQKIAIEQREIAKLVQKEESIGLQVVSDGEYPREFYHLDFLCALTGVKKFKGDHGFRFKGGIETKPLFYKVVGKIDFPDDHPFLNQFKYLKTLPKKAACKFTIPTPLLLFIPYVMNKEVYPNDIDFLADLVKTYKKAIKSFYDVGCRYLQIDDNTWTSMCDEENRQNFIKSGFDIPKMLTQWQNLFNEILKDKPNDMVISMHVCRGNYKSDYCYEGSYDFIAPYLFGGVNVDAFFLEYDDERSGTFEPLKYIKNQFVVLGLFTTKRPELEDREVIKARVKEASKYVPLDRLCISTQCGFASTEEGNNINEEEQFNKLKYIIEISKEIWK